MSGSMEKIRKELKKEIQKYADGLTKEALSDMTLERHWNEPDDTDTYILVFGASSSIAAFLNTLTGRILW